MARTSAKKAVAPAPQNLEEAAQFVATLGQEAQAINKINNDLNTKVNDLTAKAAEAAAPHKAKYDLTLEGLYAFAVANKDELTKDGKTVTVPTGNFGFRFNPPSVKLSSVEKVIAAIKSLGIKEFLRSKTVEEVDREAMLKDTDRAEAIEGVSIVRQEMFFVKPNELSAEITTNVTKGKKKV